MNDVFKGSARWPVRHIDRYTALVGMRKEQINRTTCAASDNQRLTLFPLRDSRAKRNMRAITKITCRVET